MTEERIAEFELSDVEVDTVGLVTAGAIGEDFFLTKAKRSDKVEDQDETKTVEVVDPDSESYWDKLTKVLKDFFPTEKVSASDDEEKPEDEDSTTDDEGEDTEMAKAETQETVEVVETKEVEVEKSEEVQMADETKDVQPTATVDVDELIAKIEKSVADKYAAEMTELKTRLEKAESDTAKAKEEAAEKEMIQKAREFTTLPVRYDELGRRLYSMSKSLEAEDFTWLMSTFDAVDKQLGAAGILNEFGTSKTPEELALEDKVAKEATEKKVSYRDALLGLSEAEQEQLLNQIRK